MSDQTMHAGAQRASGAGRFAQQHPLVLAVTLAGQRDAMPMAGRRPALRGRLARPLALAALAVILWACGGGPPPSAVSVGAICQQEAGTTVVAEGRLAFPMSALICTDGQCKLHFYDDTGGGTNVEFVVSRTPSPGKLTLPPNPYTDADLQITLDDGTLADRSTLVKITGPVRKRGGSCYLEAYQAELPS